MKTLLESRLAGLRKNFNQFFTKVSDFELKPENVGAFSEMLSSQMRALNYDDLKIDKIGNIIGRVQGYSNNSPLVLLANIDYQSNTGSDNSTSGKNDMIAYKAGLLTAIYTGALLKTSLLPMEGDLYVCCVPRIDGCDYGLRHLFEKSLPEKIKKIKGVIISEPTHGNINIGHKGRFEYEIVVKGKVGANVLQNRGVNMLGAMFPLINELEKASRILPHNSVLGDSNLNIKNVNMNQNSRLKDCNEFKIVIDRGFVPEENMQGILNKAKTIAKNIYKDEADLKINTLVAKEKIKTYTGVTLVAKKEYKPWNMTSHHPFVLNSLEALRESKPKASIDYWKKIVTDGSYTFAEMGIPTIGFGAGSEDDITAARGAVKFNHLEKAVMDTGIIISRNIGLPAFGWSSDEI